MPLPTRLPRWLKLINPVFMLLNRLGLAVGIVHVLTVRGRKTGAPYSTPISLMVLDGQRYIVSYPWVGWVKNARAQGECMLARGRRQEAVRLIELSPDERMPVLRAFPVLVPHGVRFFNLPPTPEAFERAAPQLTAFRVETVAGGGAGGGDPRGPSDPQGATAN